MKSLRYSLPLVLLAAATAHAQSVSPMPSPTIITSVPYTISAAGYYQLGANLSSPNTSGNLITISANNVTLDFGGHYLSGPGGTSGTTVYGVSSNLHNNINVINGTIANCYEGLNFYGDGNSTDNYNNVVNNMLITNCSHVGINFQSTFYSRATNNVVSNTGGATAANGTGDYAFYLQGKDSSLTGNIISTVTPNSNSTSSAFGIYIPGGYNAILTRNQVFNSYYGIFFAGSGKYQDNLTSDCTTAFSGGTDAGGNN